MTDETGADAVIFVLAGVNGAGKSSIAGASLRAFDVEYFDPDEVAKRLRETNKSASVDDANALAWETGKLRLESAIETRTSFPFESTLGGNTIPALLREAAEAGLEVIVWFVGLSTPERHIARVRARVARGATISPKK